VLKNLELNKSCDDQKAPEDEKCHHGNKPAGNKVSGAFEHI
jgi:hypothetical protein